MSKEDHTELIQRLIDGELDAREAKRAALLMEQDPELRSLFERLRAVASQIREAFPEPPPPQHANRFIELMRQLPPGPAAPEGPASVRRITPSEQLYFLSAGDLRRRKPSRSPTPRNRVSHARENLVAESMSWRMFGHLAQDDVGAHLFNLREIPRDAATALQLEFYAGDVLATQSEVLLTSAFASSYVPTPGSVFGAIADRYGIRFGNEPPPGSRRLPGGLLHFSDVSCPSFQSLWVIEMKKGGSAFSLRDLRQVFRSIGHNVPEILGPFSTVTLPLLGTGYQQIEPRDVVRELLSALPRWAEHPQLRTVRVFTLQLEHVAILNRALDDREFANRESSILSAASEELGRRLDEDGSETARILLKELLQIATASDPSARSIALQGRRIAETVLAGLARQGIDDLAPVALAGIAGHHLALLRDYASAATRGELLTDRDATMVLLCAIETAGLLRR